MIDLTQLRALVVRPTLQALISGGISYSLAAENLVLGTGAHESQYFYLSQVGGGPALGFWQMEPETFEDCWTNYINFRTPLATAINGMRRPQPLAPSELVTNLALACAMCRVRYARAPAPLPAATDAAALAQYWKSYYNTDRGAGYASVVIPAFQSAIGA